MSYIFGYARVSAQDQNLATQLGALTAQGCTPIFQEKITGIATSRPQLDALLAAARPGDTVVVAKFNRLGRNQRHLLELLEYFKKHDIHFRALDLGVDSTTPAGKMMMGVFAALAEYQREEILEKTHAGRELAKAQGKHMGRRPGVNQEKLEKVRKALTARLSTSDIVTLTGISETSVKRYRKLIESER